MDIATTLSTISVAKDFVSLIMQSKVDSEVQAKAVDLMQKLTESHHDILSLHGQAFDLTSKNHELLQINSEIKEELRQLQAWNAEADRYELNELCAGVFVYSLKKDAKPAEPFHHLCTNCYNKQRKSILVRSSKNYGGTVHKCPSPDCGAEYYDHSKPMVFTNDFE